MYIKRLHRTIMLCFVSAVVLSILLSFSASSLKEGYIDRMEGNQAVILFEREQVELLIPVELLPPETEEGTYILLDFRKTGKTGWRYNGQ